VESGGAFYNAINNYIATYYDLPNTADDLIPYLMMLNKTHLTPLKSRFSAFIERMSDMSTNKTRYMKALLTWSKVLRLIGAYSYKRVKFDGELWDISNHLFVNYIRSLGFEEV
jgi:hypothetical protein